MLRTARGLAGFVLVSALTGAGVLPAQVPPGSVEVDPTTEEFFRFESDGITVSGGRLGGQAAGCRASPRAYLRAHSATSTLFDRSQHAFGCDVGDSQDLFAGALSFDPAYVVGSSLYAAKRDSETGDVYAVGEIHLAWLDRDDEEVSGTGTLVLRVGADGTLRSDGYHGPVPTGPPTGGGCEMICRRAGKALEDRGGRGLILDRGGILVTGWAISGELGDRELEVIRFEGHPLTAVWAALAGTAADDIGHDLVAGDGEIFALGTTGGDRDVFLTRFLEGGIPAEQKVFAGPSDDEGRSLSFDSEGRLLASGMMSQELTFGSVVLTSEGQGERSWNAVIDRNLTPVSAEILPLEPVQPPPQAPPYQMPHQLPVEPPGRPARDSGPVLEGRGAVGDQLVDSHPALPMAYEILVGGKGRGGLKEISHSDDRYLRIRTAGTNRIELEVHFDPDPDSEPIPMYLKEVAAEVFSEFCYQATVLVNGVASQDFLVAGQRNLCPADEPILRVPISKAMSEALGFDGRQVLVNDQRVVVRLILEFSGSVDPWGNGYASEQDSSVDEVSAEVEY